MYNKILKHLCPVKLLPISHQNAILKPEFITSCGSFIKSYYYYFFKLCTFFLVLDKAAKLFKADSPSAFSLKVASFFDELLYRTVLYSTLNVLAGLR